MGARSPFRTATLAACIAMAAACGSGGDDDARPSTLLITLDTTRADALGSYGKNVGLTPNFERLSDEGVTYDAAHTVVPLTLPSHASMLTGLYPPRHTIRDNGLWPLPPSADTLAEAAKNAGYETAAFLAAVVLHPTFGLNQGFETYDAPEFAMDGGPSHKKERPADDMVNRALAWLDDRDESRPFFLWLHLFDPHAPYAPPPDLRGGAFRQNPYLGEVAAMDREVGRLLEALEKGGLLDETLILVVADHGESFGEHREQSHGAFCYQSTMRVPFVLRYPDGHRAGERSDEVVSVVDVFPTLADAMGLSYSNDLDGLSLYHNEVPEDRGVYLESYNGYFSFGWSQLAGWVDRHGKYLHSAAPEFYDLKNDPGEGTNLLSEGAEKPDLGRYQAEIRKMTEKRALDADDAGGFDEAVLEELRGLGYTAFGTGAEELPHPLQPSTLPVPWTMAEQHYETLEAEKLASVGNWPEVEKRLRRVLARNPKNYRALEHFANSLMQQQKFREAIAPLKTLTSDRPRWSGAFFNLGGCLRRAGRPDDAIEAFLRAVQSDPTEPRFLRAAIQALREAGRDEEAAGYERMLRAATSG